MKRVIPSVFVPLWCKKCKKRREHVMIDPGDPENNPSPTLRFECQDCGEKKYAISLEFT